MLSARRAAPWLSVCGPVGRVWSGPCGRCVGFGGLCRSWPCGGVWSRGPCLARALRTVCAVRWAVTVLAVLRCAVRWAAPYRGPRCRCVRFGGPCVVPARFVGVCRPARPRPAPPRCSRLRPCPCPRGGGVRPLAPPPDWAVRRAGPGLGLSSRVRRHRHPRDRPAGRPCPSGRAGRTPPQTPPRQDSNSTAHVPPLRGIPAPRAHAAAAPSTPRSAGAPEAPSSARMSRTAARPARFAPIVLADGP